MDSLTAEEVSHSFSGGVEIRFRREGACWRARRYMRGELRADDGLVDLEYVLAVLDRDSFACDRARRLDPDEAKRLAERKAA